MKRALACTFVVVTLAACGDDAEPEADAVTSTSEARTTASADPTTTTTATTTFAQADDPPDLVNTGEDFDAIVRSFVAFGEWLSVHPDVERLDEFVRGGSAAWEQLQPAFAELVDRDWHTNGGSPGIVRETRLLERPNPDLAIVYLAIDSPAFSIQDGAGRTVREVAAVPLTGWVYELRREGGGRWLLENRTVLGEV